MSGQCVEGLVDVSGLEKGGAVTPHGDLPKLPNPNFGARDQPNPHLSAKGARGERGRKGAYCCAAVAAAAGSRSGRRKGSLRIESPQRAVKKTRVGAYCIGPAAAENIAGSGPGPGPVFYAPGRCPTPRRRPQRAPAHGAALSHHMISYHIIS